MTGLLSLVNLLVLAYSVSGAPLPLQALDETAVVVDAPGMSPHAANMPLLPTWPLMPGEMPPAPASMPRGG